MRSFILGNGPLLVWLLAAAEAFVGILAAKKSRSLLAKMVAVLSFGLAVDALIQALGTVLGEGSVLQSVSQLRYLLHGVLVPLMLPISFYAFGIRKAWKKILLWLATAAVMVLGLAMGLMVKTTPVSLAGILRYATSEETPAFAYTFELVLSIGGVIPVIAVGIAHLARHKRPCLLLAGILMFAFSALAPATGNMDLNFLITMFGELFMILFFLLEIRRTRE